MARFKKFTREELENESLAVVREIGRKTGVKAPATMRKKDIVNDILAIQAGEKMPVLNYNFKGAPPKKIDLSKFVIDNDGDFNEPPINKVILRTPEHRPIVKSMTVEGVLEVHKDGYGFLRVNNYENSSDDVYVGPGHIYRSNLRRGDKLKAIAHPPKEVGSAPALYEILLINDFEPELFLKRENFDELIPCYPNQRLKLESEGETSDLAIRCIDLFAPIGKGQRGLIVAPPKTGKTTILKMMAQAIERNHKDVKLIVLLIDERPEEVTDIKRSINGEVVFSTFDESAEHHIRASELVINRAKRLVEVGKDVVILMDSITRLARAYNSVVESSGRTLSGGLDPASMQGPKRFFGSARNIDGGGSLTIISTALIDTGSRMDDVIYEEFKGTGNMEIHLSRDMSERRIFPAIDIYKSGTRKDELLLSEEERSTVYKIRKILAERGEGTDTLLEMLKKTKDNKDLIVKLDAWIKLYSK